MIWLTGSDWASENGVLAEFLKRGTSKDIWGWAGKVVGCAEGQEDACMDDSLACCQAVKVLAN